MNPVHVIRLGTIKCEIFVRSTTKGELYHAVVNRLYKNGDRWIQSTQFGRDELLTLAKIADLANTWIHLQGQAEGLAAIEGHSHGSDNSSASASTTAREVS